MVYGIWKTVWQMLWCWVICVAVIALLSLCCGCGRVPLKKEALVKEPCHVAYGTYLVTVEGAKPDPSLESILNNLCPLDIFIDYKSSFKTKIDAQESTSKCGVHIYNNSKDRVAMMITTTATSIVGVSTMLIDLSPQLSCFAYFKMTYAKVE